MRLRYLGPAPVTLMLLGMEVFPDTDIEIPDDTAQLLLARGDFLPPPESDESPSKVSSRVRRSAPSEPVQEDSAIPTGDQSTGTDTNVS